MRTIKGGIADRLGIKYGLSKEALELEFDKNRDWKKIIANPRFSVKSLLVD
jgi:hypothetical protein